ncbi:MAG: hypothetical protein ACKO96_25125, partial [Flammeovirgaceae bacterium]
LKKKTSPISLYGGLGFDYLYFGGDRTYQSFPYSNDVSVAVNSNAYGWYPYLDFEIADKSPVIPFGTAFWGARFFYTRQNINYSDALGNRQSRTKNVDGDITTIYGLGGGVKIKLAPGALLELKYQRSFGNIT